MKLLLPGRSRRWYGSDARIGKLYPRNIGSPCHLRSRWRFDGTVWRCPLSWKGKPTRSLPHYYWTERAFARCMSRNWQRTIRTQLMNWRSCQRLPLWHWIKGLPMPAVWIAWCYSRCMRSRPRCTGARLHIHPHCRSMLPTSNPKGTRPRSRIKGSLWMASSIPYTRDHPLIMWTFR